MDHQLTLSDPEVDLVLTVLDKCQFSGRDTARLVVQLETKLLATRSVPPKPEELPKKDN